MVKLLTLLSLEIYCYITLLIIKTIPLKKPDREQIEEKKYDIHIETLYSFLL